MRPLIAYRPLAQAAGDRGLIVSACDADATIEVPSGGVTEALCRNPKVRQRIELGCR
jgi:hypothetical protein